MGMKKKNAFARSITAYPLSRAVLICSSKYMMTDIAATVRTTIGQTYSRLLSVMIHLTFVTARLVNYMGL